MTEIQKALQKLAALNGQVTSDIIGDLVADSRQRHTRYVDLYRRYRAEPDGVPVFSRTFTDTTKINNKINNAFDAECVDTKVGYMFGRPVVYMVDRTEYIDDTGEWVDKDGYDRMQAVLDDFLARNVVRDLDAETGRMAAICGLSARLAYIDREGQERLMNVPPWECIWVYDMSINEPQYALRYYTVQTREGDAWIERTRVEWYDDTNVTFYVSGKDGTYALDTDALRYDAVLGDWIPDNPKRHMFDYIPLIAFPNNEELQGDAEKALELIDGYDRALSDVNSEIDQLRLAYMVFKGAGGVDEATMRDAMKTGAFGIAPEGDVGFIEKNINDTFVENHLNRLEDNILRFSRHVNFGDEAFAGNQSGVALKFKMFGLESKCATAELKFKRALNHQWRVLCSAWRRKGIYFAAKPEDGYLNIFADFSRNFPLHILEEAQATSLLKGMISEQTRLTMLSFVDDPNYEITAMKKEREETMALENELLGEGIGAFGTSVDDALPPSKPQVTKEQV